MSALVLQDTSALRITKQFDRPPPVYNLRVTEFVDQPEDAVRHMVVTHAGLLEERLVDETTEIKSITPALEKMIDEQLERIEQAAMKRKRFEMQRAKHEMEEQEQAELARLRALREVDQKVKRNVRSVKSELGDDVGLAILNYTRGPDGKVYAVSAEVGTTTTKISAESASSQQLQLRAAEQSQQSKPKQENKTDVQTKVVVSTEMPEVKTGNGQQTTAAVELELTKPAKPITPTKPTLQATAVYTSDMGATTTGTINTFA